ncbi:MAG: winged helix-turn-helix transcriptional regulator [Candidatus Aureabacteria bacterium]|nr:winged helix-turn-helix transcriptional regulator [Candidatus Auribacterota bacterium]
MDISDYRRFSDFFNALSHPIRVEIVLELLDGKKCVTDIGELLGVRQPNVSQHLAVLKSNNIVDWHQEGKMKCYFLKNPERMRNILKVLKK